jgi:SNF2 family DNA or RNA helicase
MLRRTKDSELHGKKILQLPPKTVDIVELEFTDEERAIYQAIEAAARVKVNRWFEAGKHRSSSK